jgi:hypothetical protein
LVSSRRGCGCWFGPAPRPRGPRAGQARVTGEQGQDTGEGGRRADGHHGPDGHAGPGGRGEEGCLVPGGSNRAERDHAPGNRAAREKVAQRTATQRDEGQQQAAHDDA